MVTLVKENSCPQNHRCPVVSSCPTGAISQVGFALPTINPDLCTDCGRCTKLCYSFVQE